jgi:carbon-monoxide dehydrogenase large subunit
VAVDPDTGQWEILSLTYVCEAGRVLDRMGAEATILSALDHATAKMKYWDIQYDPVTGTRLTQTHLDNKHSTSLDVPFENYQFAITESIGAFGPYGGHGWGEPPCANLAVVANAINNALGTKICQRPIYPADVLKALGK